VAEKWTPERRRELTRTALMDAAAEVFARRGFSGASLEEIAETAGFSRGAIYKNFESKEELFLAVLDRRIEDQLKGFSQAFEREGAIAAMDPARMAAVWRENLSGGLEWLALDLEFRLYAIRNPEVRKRLAAHEQAFRRAVAKFMEEHSSSLGITFNIPVDTLAGIVLPATQGFSESASLDPEAEDNYAAFLELVIGAVVDQPRPRSARRRVTQG
jgi:AcrR family transcriptional regulator